MHTASNETSIWSDDTFTCTKITGGVCHHEGYYQCACSRGTRVMMIARSSREEAIKLLSTQSLANGFYDFLHLHLYHVRPFPRILCYQQRVDCSQATLKSVKGNPRPQIEPVSPKKMSDLFLCDKSQFGKPQSTHPDTPGRIKTMSGPNVAWPPPSVPNYQFKDGLACLAPSVTTKHLLPRPCKLDTRVVTRFAFIQERPRSVQSSSSSAVNATWKA